MLYRIGVSGAWNSYFLKPVPRVLLHHVTTITMADFMLMFLLQKLLSLLALLTLQAFMCMLQVFFSVFSVFLWHNYRAKYWSGMYTTSVWVGFSGFLCTQIFLEKTLCLDRIRKALASCGWALTDCYQDVKRRSNSIIKNVFEPNHLPCL